VQTREDAIAQRFRIGTRSDPRASAAVGFGLAQTILRRCMPCGSRSALRAGLAAELVPDPATPRERDEVTSCTGAGEHAAQKQSPPHTPRLLPPPPPPPVPTAAARAAAAVKAASRLRGSPLRSTLPRPLKQPSRPPPSCEPRLPAAARRAARRVPRLPRHRTPRRRRFPPAAASESAQPPPLPPPAESVRNEPVLPRSESSCVYEMYQVGCARGRKERGGRAISRLMAGGASRRGSIYSFAEPPT